jgi:hypothetical protein
MTGHTKRTPQAVETARAMRHSGHTFREIGGELGVHQETIREWLGLKKHRNIDRLSTGPREKQSFRPTGPLPVVPQDTRSLSARLCGDPLPGRSALDKRGNP